MAKTWNKSVYTSATQGRGKKTSQGRDNVEELMPDQTHVFGNRQMHLSFMSDKWIMKILKNNPHITTYKELLAINEQQQEKYLDRRI